MVVVAYSLEMCVNACQMYNEGKEIQEWRDEAPNCTTVLLQRALGYYFSDKGGNCFLKSRAENGVDSRGEATAAIICEDGDC
jgi:hypothetical protein